MSQDIRQPEPDMDVVELNIHDALECAPPACEEIRYHLRQAAQLVDAHRELER